MKEKKAGNLILGALFSFCMVLIVLITSFEAAMYLDFGVYEQEYKKYDVLSELDMEMDDVMHVTREMMAYLRGGRSELRVITTVEGKQQDFFNEQDRLHMKDVRELFLGGLYLRIGAACIAAASLFFLLRKPGGVRGLARGCQAVLAGCTILILLLGIGVARNFNAVFVAFHKIFFSNDLWLFDPAEDYMIRMLPEGLFYDMLLRIGVLFAAGLAVMLAVSVILLKIPAGRKAGKGTGK